MTKPDADLYIIPIRASRFYPHFQQGMKQIELKAKHGIPLYKEEAEKLEHIHCEMRSMELAVGV